MGDYSDLTGWRSFASGAMPCGPWLPSEHDCGKASCWLFWFWSPLLSAGAAPANDSFTNATVLTGVSGATSGRTVGATKEPGEPNDAGNVGVRSVF